MEDLVQAALSPQAMGGVLIGAFAAGALLLAAGLLIGAPGIYMVKGLIRGLLVGVSPYDPLTLLGAALRGLKQAFVAGINLVVRDSEPPELRHIFRRSKSRVALSHGVPERVDRGHGHDLQLAA